MLAALLPLASAGDIPHDLGVRARGVVSFTPRATAAICPALFHEAALGFPRPGALTDALGRWRRHRSCG